MLVLIFSCAAKWAISGVAVIFTHPRKQQMRARKGKYSKKGSILCKEGQGKERTRCAWNNMENDPPHCGARVCDVFFGWEVRHHHMPGEGKGGVTERSMKSTVEKGDLEGQGGI